MLCCLNASLLGKALLSLLETKYRARQTTDLMPYNPVLERRTLAQTQPAMGMKRTGMLSVIPTIRRQMFMRRLTPLPGLILDSLNNSEINSFIA